MRQACLHLQGQPAGQDVSRRGLRSAFCSLRNRKTCFPAFSTLNGLVLRRETSPLNPPPKAARKAGETKLVFNIASAASSGPPQIIIPSPGQKGRIREAPEAALLGRVLWSSPKTPAFSERQTGPCQTKIRISKRRRLREHRSTGYSVSTPEQPGLGQREASLECHITESRERRAGTARSNGLRSGDKERVALHS